MQTIQELTRVILSHPYLCLGLGFGSTVVWGLVRLAAILPH